MSLLFCLLISTCTLSFSAALECHGDFTATYECPNGLNQCYSYEVDASNVDPLLKKHINIQRFTGKKTRHCDGFGFHCKQFGLEAGGQKEFNILELRKAGLGKNIEIPYELTENDFATDVGSVATIVESEKAGTPAYAKKMFIALFQQLRFRYTCCSSKLCNEYTLA